MPKIRVKTLPEGQEAELYEQDGDGYILKQDAVDAFEHKLTRYQDQVSALNEDLTVEQEKAKKLRNEKNEFRQNNIALKAELEELQGGNKGDFNDKFNKALEEALAPIKSSKEELEKERNSLSNQLTEVVLSDKIKTTALQDGVYETALTDVVNRAKQVFTVKDGKAIPKDETMRDKEGNLLSPETWLKSLANSAPHFFKQSVGGNAKGSRSKSDNVNRTSTDKIADGLRQL